MIEFDYNWHLLVRQSENTHQNIENVMSTSSDTKAWSPRTQKLVLWTVGILGFLGLLYYNYVSFFGGLMSADPASADCIKTNAIITDIHASGGGSRKSRETYFMSYEYKVNEQTINGKEEVTYSIYSRSRLNGEIEICYMKDKIGRSAVIGNDVRGQDLIYVFILDLAFVIVVVMVIRAGFKRRKKAALVA